MPFALAAAAGTVRRIGAVAPAARRAGVAVGMSVADALAVVPALALAPADPAADRAVLARLADWCGQYTPWTAIDESADDFGLWLDVGGCAHLFGGETGLLAHLHRRLRRLGFSARAALADTPGAAWAWARHGDAAAPCVAAGGQRDALAPLPVAALRLPAGVAATLSGLGLRRVGDLYALPRATLAARFGPVVALRLDQALGRVSEPLSPRRPPPRHGVEAAFVEPIVRAEDVAEATRLLLERLCRHLEAEGVGLRRLEVTAFRVDALSCSIAIGTSRPSREAAHLFRLLAEDLAALDPGFGIERLCLSAAEVAPQPAGQGDLDGAMAGAADDDFARLLDALGNRLGFERVLRLVPRQSHLPEQAVAALSPTAPLPSVLWPAGRRPLRLFDRPEPVEAVAPLPDSPPLLFRWRNRSHRVARADGAERIAAEWWRETAPERDYYLVEDQAGRRFWLFRQGAYGAGPPPRWYMHGIFP